MLGSWASSDLLTNLKTLLLPKKDARGLCVWQCLHKTRKKYDQLSCRTYCTACLFVCGEKTIVTVPQCWPQFVCTPGSAGACVCAGNRMGVPWCCNALTRKTMDLKGADRESRGPFSIVCIPTDVHYHTWPLCFCSCIMREVFHVRITGCNTKSPQIWPV